MLVSWAVVLRLGVESSRKALKAKKTEGISGRGSTGHSQKEV